MSEEIIKDGAFQRQQTQTEGLVPTKPVYFWAILIVLFVAAFAVRLYGITDPPVDFHVTRQYHSALVARGMYFEHLNSIPEWQREIATINKDIQDVVEPRIMEILAAFAYSVAGRELLWLPRVFSALFWVIGGGFLFACAKKLFSVDAAFFAAAFYLLAPYGVIASRSFQPDPLMVALILLSLWMMLRYHEQPSMLNLALLVIATALAMLVKAVAVFFVFAGFLSLDVGNRGFLKSLFRPSAILFFVGSLLPSVLYYGNGLFVAGFLRDNEGGSFIPSLFLSENYWAGSLLLMGAVIGYTALVGALLGLIVMRRGFPRRFMGGLWMGYLVFGLIFNYHFSTHDYYHLPLIPIAALSLCPLVDVVMRRIAQDKYSPLWRASILILVVTIATVLRAQDIRWLVERVRGYEHGLIQYAPKVGEYVSHSSRTVLLSSDYGKPLMYYGEISGSSWPMAGDFWAAKLRREPTLSVKDRLDILIPDYQKQYFIVTNFDEFNAQTDLREYLYGHYTILAQTPDYIIFDLRTELDE